MNSRPLPQCLPGFEHVDRRWDQRLNRVLVKVKPGEFYVTTQNELIMTVLGSCISVCIRDKRFGIAGMNHFLLPLKGEHMEHALENGSNFIHANDISSAARYGNWSMEYLINGILKQGGSKKNLEIKVFGGGAVLETISSMSVGQENINFVQDYLVREELKCSSIDVGGVYPRKILYYPETGRVRVKKLRDTSTTEVRREEQTYVESLGKTRKPDSSDIELFD